MSKLWESLRRHVGHGTAKADTWAAAVALFVAGWTGANGDWLWTVIAAVLGLVFLISSGSYCWRKGYFAAKRESA